ncbi:MAG: hypothetical protein Q9181_004335 [Wetmoreana brouardii]
MPATKNSILFGRRGMPDIDIELPHVLKATDGSGTAVVKIDIDVRADSATWYEIWEAVNAVAYMCGRPEQRRGGKATKIGTLGNIYIELYNQALDLDQPKPIIGDPAFLEQLDSGNLDGQNSSAQIEFPTAPYRVTLG